MLESTRWGGRVGAKKLGRSAGFALLCALAAATIGACSAGDGVDSTGPEAVGAEPAAAQHAELRAATITALQRDAAEAYDFALGAAAATLRSHNPAQGFSAQLEAAALQIVSDPPAESWAVELRWTGVGRDGAISPPADLTRPAEATRNRASFERIDGSEEWYLNGPLGIEQGFTLSMRPAGHGPLVVELTVAGDLAPVASESGERVWLASPAGETALQYTDLYAHDASGQSLSASMAVAGPTIRLVVDDVGARYPVRVDPLIWQELHKLTAGDPAAGDELGIAVALSGDTAVVGAGSKAGVGASAGAAYVFDRDQGGSGQWGQVAKLTASDSEADDEFGSAVAIDGDIAVVGAWSEATGGFMAGAAYVFYRDDGGTDAWGEVKKITADDAFDEGFFGASVSVSGSLLVVGSPGESTVAPYAGAAYVFAKDQGVTDGWGQVGKLTAGDGAEDDYFGGSVGISGTLVIAGAAGVNIVGDESGAAYLFAQDQGAPGAWGEVRKLTASDPGANDSLGASVAVAGDLAVAGAPNADGAASNSGAAYLFAKDQGGTDAWGEVKKLTADGAAAEEYLGDSVAISGDLVLAGGSGEASAGTNAGAAWSFARNEGGPDNWGLAGKLTANDAEAEDAFGYAVALSGTVALVGAWGEDAGGDDAGAAYVLQARSANGDSCTADTECDSGHCVDGVCCDSECGGGAADDCQACSVAAGGAVDGTCGARPDGEACDDGLFCTASDTCEAGACAGGTDPCAGPDGDDDCRESCDEAAASCTAADPDGSACPDGTCEAGACETGGTGGAGGGPPPAEEDSGCGCRVAGERGRPAGALGLVLLGSGLLLPLRRRRALRAPPSR